MRIIHGTFFFLVPLTCTAFVQLHCVVMNGKTFMKLKWQSNLFSHVKRPLYYTRDLQWTQGLVTLSNVWMPKCICWLISSHKKENVLCSVNEMIKWRWANVSMSKYVHFPLLHAFRFSMSELVNLENSWELNAYHVM